MGAITLAVALRLAFAFGYWVDKPLTQDEREYLALADNVARGRGFSYGRVGPEGTAQQFSRAPLYPMFLSAVMRASTVLGLDNGIDRQRRPIRIASTIQATQALLGGLVVWLVAMWAARAAGPRAGGIAALLAAVYPPLVWMPAYALSETLFSALALGGALLITVASERAGAGERQDRLTAMQLMLFGGLLAGLATLTRSAMLVSLPFFSLWLIGRRQLILLGMLILATGILVSPWTIRNIRQYGRLVIVASDGGVTFWTGNNRLATGEGDLAANPDMKRANLELRARYPGSTAEALEPIYYRDAFADIRDHPAWWATLLVRKLFFTIVPIGPSYTLHSRLYFWASVLSYGLVLPLAVAGFRTLGRRREHLMGLWCLAASTVVVCVVFFPQERFRIPIIDPTLVVCAGIWIASVARGSGIGDRESKARPNKEPVN